MKIKLYKCFEHWNNFNVIWVFSDPHFNDKESAEINPNWPPAEAMVKMINSKVGKHDALIILGDIGDLSYVSKLKGYKILLTGNHDAGVSNYLKKYLVKDPNGSVIYSGSYRECADYINELEYDNKGNGVTLSNDNMFDEVYGGPLFINDKILLSHEPIKLPFGLNIHGHCHSAEQSIYHADQCGMVNVCSDVIDFTPKRLDEIVNNFKVKDLHRIVIDNAATTKKCVINNVNCGGCFNNESSNK